MSPNAMSAPLIHRLNRQFNGAGALDVLEQSIKDPQTGRVALVSSFGAESVVLLHLLSRVCRQTPVLFIDTEMLFKQTLDYQLKVTRILGLTDVRILRPDPSEVSRLDPDRSLHKSAPDMCCNLRKTRPLQDALTGFESWITGRKHHHNGQRSQLPFFEDDNNGHIKVNPLIHWAPAKIRSYMEQHELPFHPLVKRGYASIGCAPCTSPVGAGETARAGRWRGHEKQECGIHFTNGAVNRNAFQGEVL